MSTLAGIGAYHPQIVHFVVALLVVGVAFRVLWLTGRVAFAGPAATTLIVLGTLASLAAVKSGDDAHGPVERMPGLREAVVEHEAWGERARNIFVAVSLMELAVLVAAARQSRAAQGLGLAAAVVGLGGLVVLYQAAERGGRIVYAYAGGVGLRTGDPADVDRLLIAGLYHKAVQDRASGRPDDAAALIELAAARFPQHVEVQLMHVEWMTDVRMNPAGALARLDQLQVPATDPRLRLRAGLARAAALEAMGSVDAARAVLQTLRSEFPTSPTIQRRLDALNAPG
ncbi:MAG: DUF2231 domain-containing protein [Acidobacteriota bacterium]